MEEVTPNNVQQNSQNNTQNYIYNPDQAFKKNPYKKIGYTATLSIIGLLIISALFFLLVPEKSNNQIDPFIPNKNDNTVDLLSNQNNTNETNQSNNTLENNATEEDPLANVTISVVQNTSNNSVEN